MSDKPDYMFQIPASLLMKLTGADNTEQAVALAGESFGANVRIVITEPIVMELNKAPDPQYYQKFRDNRRTRSKK